MYKRPSIYLWLYIYEDELIIHRRAHYTYTRSLGLCTYTMHIFPNVFVSASWSPRELQRSATEDQLHLVSFKSLIGYALCLFTYIMGLFWYIMGLFWYIMGLFWYIMGLFWYMMGVVTQIMGLCWYLMGLFYYLGVGSVE